MATETFEEHIPVANLRDDPDAVIDHAQETKQPIVVTRDGKAAVILIDAVQYQEEMQERDHLRVILAGKMIFVRDAR